MTVEEKMSKVIEQLEMIQELGIEVSDEVLAKIKKLCTDLEEKLEESHD